MKVSYLEEVEREKLICDTCKETINKKKMWRVFQDGCVCGKKCERKLKILKDMDYPNEVRIKIGWFWRRVNTRKLIKTLEDAQHAEEETNGN